MVLVTGGTGLVGSHLLYELISSGKIVRALKRASGNIQNTYKVFSYYHKNAQELFEAIEWVDVDFSDMESLIEAHKGITEVYHCAALVSYYPQDANKMLKWNTIITANMVNTALETKVEKFCMVSSVAAIGKEKDSEVIQEEHIWKNDPKNSNYSISKYLSEMEVWRGIEEGLNAVIVNPSIIIGPGNWNASSSTLFKTAHKGMAFYTDGEGGFVDVKDVVSCMINLMNVGAFGNRYIINAENRSFRSIFTSLASAFGVKEPSIRSTKNMSGLLWRIEWLRNRLFGAKPIITKETARSAHGKSVYCNNRIKETISIEFRAIDSAIEEYAQYYLADIKKQ